MLDSPRVSVVIPFYNAAATLERAVASVVRQTMPDWELIIVDDCSPVPAEGAFSVPSRARLRIIRHNVNKGAAAARNTGVRASTGQMVAFLDADDTWHPEKLARQIAAFESAAPNVAASVTGFALYRDGAARSELYSPSNLNPLLDSLVDGCAVGPGSTLLTSRRVFDEIGFFDEGLRRLEDWDWLIRLAQRHELHAVPDILADIHVSRATGDVNLPAVLAATRILRERYLFLMSEGGPIRRRRFLATLLIEDAAAYYRSGRNGKAALFAFRAFLLWPLQRRGLMRRLFCRFGALLPGVLRYYPRR